MAVKKMYHKQHRALEHGWRRELGEFLAVMGAEAVFFIGDRGTLPQTSEIPAESMRSRTAARGHRGRISSWARELGALSPCKLILSHKH